MSVDAPKYPNVHVKLVGTDGNANMLIAKVASAIRKSVGKAEATQFIKDAMDQKSYDALLVFMMETVDVQ